MTNPDLLLYAVHVCFRGSVAIAKSHTPTPGTAPTTDVAPKAPAEVTAPFSRALLALHSIAFGIMCFGVRASPDLPGFELPRPRDEFFQVYTERSPN